MMASTIKDVARVAGVSITTVSRVLNGNYPVSQETRKRVEAAIRACNYSRDHVARSLVTRKTFTIGVVGTEIINPYFAEMLHYIQEAANEQSYQVLFQSTGSPSAETRAVQTLLNRRVDGLIMIAREEEAVDVSHIREAARHIPVVLIGMPFSEPGVFSIHANERQGMFQLANELVGQGHRGFLFLGGSQDSFPATERLRGLEQSLASDGNYRLEVEHSGYDAETNVKALYRRAERGLFHWCTAIVCVSDYVAMSAIGVLHDLGMAVPRDVSITGFDNVWHGQYVFPRLTTVDLQKERLAHVAVETVLKELDEKNDREVESATLVAAPVVLRGSHGPAPRRP